jgi:hypothetical protein
MKQKMASSFPIPDSILSDYSMPTTHILSYPAPLLDSKPYQEDPQEKRIHIVVKAPEPISAESKLQH